MNSMNGIAAGLLSGQGLGGRMNGAMGRAAMAQFLSTGAMNAGFAPMGLAGAHASALRSAGLNVDGTVIDPPRTQSTSNKRCIRKTGRREEKIAAPLDVVERPLRLRKTGVSPGPKSVWSSLRDLVTGKKVLKNNFSFKMKAVRDKRGLMAIPLRHDGNFGFSDPEWAVGAQSRETHPDGTGGGGDGFGEYSTMLREPVQAPYGSIEPYANTSNVIVPRLNLPTLEQTSWDLNSLKIAPTDNLDRMIEATEDPADPGGPPLNKNLTLLTPVQQLGGTSVPINYDSIQNALPNQYPAPKNSYARRQAKETVGYTPYLNEFNQLPKFKTQLGGGQLKMRICNQGMNQCSVEFVVLKVKDVLQPTISADGQSIETKGENANMTRFWRNIWRSVGDRYRRKLTSSLSYAMGDEQPNSALLQNDPIINPYKTWLPESHFHSKFLGDNVTASEGASDLIGGTTATVAATNGTVEALAENTGFNTDQDPDTFGKGSYPAGTPTMYRPVGRGHCTISAAGERTVSIPIPGSNYNASELQTGKWGEPTDVLDGAAVLPMSDQSYIVCMSVNGSLQDIIEPNQNNGNDSIRVLGKAYTDAIIDVHCQYTETVYPSHCDYAEISAVKYNLGSVRSAQVETGTNSLAFSGKVLPMTRTMPVTATGVLRCGANDRGGSNDGTL